jgi:hypothetical protein
MIFRKWLKRFRYWLFRKIITLERFQKALSLPTWRLHEVMQPIIEKYTDEQLDEVIKNFKEGNTPLVEYLAAVEKAGLKEQMLQWLEGEKFLREHRKKYHLESEGENER